jgi:translation initiation factor IF-1
MNRSDTLELEGTIREVLPNSTFRVKLAERDHIITCYIGGKLKQHKIRISLGDSVRIEVSAYDLTKGRIVYRF